MHRPGAPRFLLSLFLGLATAAALGPPPAAAQEHEGKAIYDQWCAGCHAEDGTGNGVGAANMLPRPRDFTLAQYQVRTTGTGELPTDDDILHVIDVGMPGTAMPGWEDLLSAGERRALVEYLKTFSRFFGDEEPEPLDLGGRAPGMNPERLADGRRVYEMIECWQCHGQAGRGDGESAPTLNDDQGLPIVAADLTQKWTFNGGSTVTEIYRRLRTGLDGTPMPSFSDLIDAEVITDDELWNLAGYIESLSPVEGSTVQEVIRATRLEAGELPSSVDDERWAEVERFYIPLVGQILIKPRWFNPRVKGVWVQGIHDGGELAVLVSWTDPSQSPDPDWGEFGGRIVELMEPKDEGAATDVGGPDQVIVQFPQELSTGMQRPFFFHGDARRPTYLWRWASDQPGAREAIARGFGSATDQTGQGLTSAASHADGEWRVLFRRSLTTDDPEDLQFPVAQAVPVAFQAFDGDNGEQGAQGAISTWYYIYLAEPAPATVFVAPLVAMMMTIVFGMMIVSRAQKRERSSAGSKEAGDHDVHPNE